jgi:hypothetical protein
VIDNVETFPESTNIPSNTQWFRSYGHCNLGRGIKSGHMKLSGQFGTLRTHAIEFWENSEQQISREFYDLSNEG